MALSTIYDILGEVVVRGNISTTTTSSGLYTDTILKGWLDPAHRWAAAFHKWPFTEGRVSTTYSTEENPYPEGWKSDSIRLLQVGGKRYQKLNFYDYQAFREDSPDSDDRVFSDFGLTYFVNPNQASGTTTVYGQYTPSAFDTTDNTATTVFSSNEPEANEAIVEEMLSYAKRREKNLNESQVHHNRAIEILESVWKRYGDEQFGYQTKNRGNFKRLNVMYGVLDDELLKRDQFY